MSGIFVGTLLVNISFQKQSPWLQHTPTEFYTDASRSQIKIKMAGRNVLGKYQNGFCQYCPTLTKPKISMYLVKRENVSVQFTWKNAKHTANVYTQTTD